jgi:hypothetical protein
MSKTVIIDGKRYTVPDDATLEEIEALLAASAPKPMTQAEQAQDVLAGVNRGAAPYATAAALGGGVGSLFGGVGAVPGAAAGVAAVGAAQFVGDPLIDAVNSFFGTKFTKPTEALNQLMDAAGMPKPQGEGGQMAQAVTSGAVGALSGVGAARSIAAGAAPGSFTQGVAQTMAAAPVSQIVAGGTGAGGAELARQSGADPIVQTLAGLGAGLGGGLATNMAGNFGSKIGMATPPRSDLPMLEQGFDNTTNMTVRVPMQQQQRAPLPMTYEDVARDARTAATGGMGSQQAVERLARAAPLNKDAAAAAERLGIDVPPDVLMDHRQLKEAVGLTRSMPGTVASAAWVDAVERAATQADEAMKLIDGSRDLSEVSDTVRKSMNDTKAALETQAGEMYDLINAKIRKGAPAAAGAAAPDVEALKQQGFDVDAPLYHGTGADFEKFNTSGSGTLGPGVYLTRSKKMADQYGNVEGGRVIPVYVRKDRIATQEDYFDFIGEPGNVIADEMKARGFEGVEYKYPGGPSETVIFDPRNLVRGDRPTAPAASKPSASVDLPNSRRLMNEVLYGEDGKSGLGGNKESLTTLEKKVLELSATGRKTPVMYDELVRLRQDIGAAKRKQNSPYGDVNTAILNRLYGVLAEDQLLAVERLGGKQMANDFKLANQVYAKQSELGETIVSLFGDPRTGSIARKLTAALQSGSKGDVAGFNRIIDELPADLRKKAVASTIAAIAKEDKTNAFGFSNYVKLYQNLRDNSVVYKKVIETLGPENEQFLNDLFKISKRITEARANVKTTGQANQALVQGLMAEGLVEGVLRKTVGSKTVMGVPIVGPIVEALTKSNKNKLGSAGDLFASPEWQQLVINVSTKQQVNQKIYNAAKNSNAFRKWAREAGITDPDQWLRSAISSTIGMGVAAKSAAPYEAGMGREATE